MPGTVWRDPAPHQGLGPGLSAVPVPGSWSFAVAQEQPAVQWNVSQFSQHWAVPFLLTVVHFPKGVLCHLCRCADKQVLYHCHYLPSAWPWGSPCLHYAVLSTWRSAVKLDSMGCAQSADSTVCQGKSLWPLSLGSNETVEERLNYKNEILVESFSLDLKLLQHEHSFAMSN